MRSIALWAHHHRWTARILILFCYLLLNLMAFALGNILELEGISIHSFWMYAAALLSLTILLAYPTRKDKKAYRQAFQYRKLLDGLLVACTFFIMAAASNNHTFTPSFSPSPAAASAIQPRVIPLQYATPEPQSNSLNKKERKALFKNIKRELRIQYKKMDTGSKVALILLAIGIAILAGYGIALLACSVACSGAETLGLIIWILGWAGIIVLLVRTISRITKGPRKKKEVAEPVPG